MTNNPEDEEATNAEVAYFLEEFAWVNPQFPPEVKSLLSIVAYRLYDSDRDQANLKECLTEAILVASDLLDDLDRVINMGGDE
jgi:hypothetical protein